MTELDPNALATNGGFAAGLLWVLYRIGLRMIAVMDRMAGHTSSVDSKVTALSASVETIIKLTGIGRRARTSPDGAPIPDPVDDPKTP